MIIKKTTANEVSKLFSIDKNQQHYLQGHFEYLEINEIWKEQLIVAVTDQKTVAGILGYQKSPREEEPHDFWLNYVSVSPNFRGHGIAKSLLEAMFHDIKKNDPEAILKLSYTETGQVLQDTILSLACHYSVTLWHKKLNEFDYKKISSQ